MIEIESKDIEKAQKKLAGIKFGIEKALSATINHALGKIKTGIKKTVRAEYYIKNKDVEKTLKVKKASKSLLTGTIVSTSTRTAISKFAVTKGRKGIKVAISKKEGRKLLQGKPNLYGRPFTAIVRNKHLGVFQRKTANGIRLEKGKWKSPMKELYTISIPEMLGNKNIQEYVKEEAAKLIPERLDHEIERILRGIK